MKRQICKEMNKLVYSFCSWNLLLGKLSPDAFLSWSSIKWYVLCQSIDIVSSKYPCFISGFDSFKGTHNQLWDREDKNKLEPSRWDFAWSKRGSIVIFIFASLKFTLKYVKHSAIIFLQAVNGVQMLTANLEKAQIVPFLKYFNGISEVLSPMEIWKDLHQEIKSTIINPIDTIQPYSISSKNMYSLESRENTRTKMQFF